MRTPEGYMRYPTVVDAEREIARSAKISYPELIPGRRIAVLEALYSPRPDRICTDFAYFIDENHNAIDFSNDCAGYSWIGLVGLTVAERDIHYKTAIRAVVYGLDIPWLLVPTIGQTAGQSFPAIAEILSGLFSRLDERFAHPR